MTKFQLVQIAAKTTGHGQRKCAKVFNELMRAIAYNLLHYNTVQIRGLATFEAHERKARMARNPKTGAPHPLEKRRAVFVRFSPDIKNNIKPASPQGRG